MRPPGATRDEVGQTGEREAGFGFDGSVLEDVVTERGGLLDAGLPEDRLADPRLPVQGERARLTAGPRDEVADRLEFLFAPDDSGGGHGSAAILSGAPPTPTPHI